jgi:hypothetical protein
MKVLGMEIPPPEQLMPGPISGTDTAEQPAVQPA